MLDRFRDWLTGHPARTMAWGWILALTLIVCVGLFATRAWSATATVEWINATQYEDGTNIPPGGLVETQIEYAKCTAPAAGQQPTWPATVDGTKPVAFPGAATDITGLTYGAWCFRARHKASDGQFSVYAGPVWKQYLAPPKPPTLLTVKGIVWEMRMHPVDGPYLARVIGTVEAGKQCLGLAPQVGFDIFAINPKDADLTKKPNPNGLVVAQCEIS